MRHRDDLQGLRAVAVLLVVLNHAGVPVLGGGYVGVDVFFVLSGFLITGLLLAQAERRGSVSLGEFYVRRARRILPAAVLTLVVTDIAAFYLLNFVRARQAVSDSIWASLFGANIHFAAQQSDYFAQGQPASPVLQFWTLSVEEQFYLVWPAVLSLALFGALFGRRVFRGRSVEPRVGRLLLVLAVAGTASLVWSIHSTDTSPTTSYFSTFARAWELALGAGLAVAASRLTRLPQQPRVALGWLGLGAIASAAVLFSSSTPFPGYAALQPTVGAALVIAAGIGRDTRFGAGRLLSIAPFRYVGDRSYALYLWHWPVLIIATQYAGHDLSVGAKLLLVAVAFLLSIASYRFFENPIRRLRWRVRFGALLWPASAAAVLVVALPILGSLGSTAARFDAAAAAVRPAALTDPAAVTAAKTNGRPLPAVVAAVRAAQRGAHLPSQLTPSVSTLKKDVWHFPKGCIPTPESTSSNLCRIGDLNAKKTMVVFGDSHAQMWMPTLLRLAARESWTIIPVVKASCIPRRWAEPGKCNVWYRWARQHAAALHPQVTLIVASWANAYGPGLAVKPIGAISRAMKRSSLSVIVVGDAPGQSQDPVDCLLAPGANMKTCTTTARRSQLRADDLIASNAKRDGVGFINTRGWFCARVRRSPDTLCPLVVNQTITAIDRGHISQTYGLELVPSFRAAFRRALFGYA